MKLNRALATFCITIILSFVIVKNVIESSYLSSYISDKITQIVSSKLNAEVKFESLKLGVFPLSTTFKNVFLDIKEIEEKIDLRLELEAISLSFSIFDLFTNQFVLDDLQLYRGEIYLDIKEREEKQAENEKFDIKKINLTSLFNDHYVSLQQELPFEIREIGLNQIILRHSVAELEIDYLNINLFPRLLAIDANIEKLKLESVNDSILDFDSLQFNVQLDREKLNVIDFKLYQQLNVIEFQGELLQKEAQLGVEGNLGYKGGLEKLEFIDENLKDKLKGFATIDGKLNGPIENPFGHIKAEFIQLETPYLIAESLQFELEKKESHILLNNLLYKKRGGEISLVNPVELFDTDSWQVLLRPMRVELKKAYTNDFLYALDNDLNILKAYASGVVDLKFFDGDLHISPIDKLTIYNFELREDSHEEKILSNERIEATNAEIIVHETGGVSIKAVLTTGNETKIEASGSVTKSGVDFVLERHHFNFLEFGKIAGVEIRGRGDLAGRIFGKGNDVNFEFNGNIKDVGVLDLEFGDGKLEVGYNLKTSYLSIRDFKSNFLGSEIEAKGIIDLSSNQRDSDLDVKVVDMRSNHLFKIAPSIFKGVSFLDEDLFANLNGQVKLSGGLSDSKIKLKGKISGNNIIFHEEEFNNINFNLNMDNGTLRFEDLILEKALAKMTGRLVVNTITDFIEYDLSLNNLKLRDFNLYRVSGLPLDSDLSGDFYGSGIGSSFQSNNNLYFKNSRVDAFRYEDSSVRVISSGKNFEIKGSFLGDTISLVSQIKEKGHSQLALDVRSFPVKNGLVFISEHNLSNEGIGGFLDFNMLSVFDINDFSTLDLTLDLRNISLIKNSKYIRLEKPTKLSVSKGVINDWNLSLEGTLGSIKSIGRGAIRRNYSVESNLILDAELATLLDNKIQRASGQMAGSVFLKGDQQGTDLSMNMNGEALSVRFDGTLGNITDGNMQVMLENNVLTLNHFRAKYGRGNVEANGHVAFRVPYPEVSLEYKVDNTQLPILKKSSIIVSGSGALQGKSVPYNLHGNFTLNQGEVIEELSDLSSDSGVDSSYGRFLPKENLDIVPSLFTLNIDVDLERPLVVRNNLVELFFEGDISLRGDIDSPLITGRLNANPNNSKFVFRGNEFKINEGEILFRDEGRKQSPLITFVGNSMINKYNVKLEVLGPTDNLSINLSSDPQLSQSDLFSLLALGITSDLSKDLDETQRRSVTTVGIGSLIADQLKINQGLKSSLGLKLSVLPEFGEDESTLLQGKSAVSDSSVGRMKSSTKVKIQKKLMDRVDMAVSSTVGGTLEQKQEMNINYNLNNNVSIEGVYEIRSSNEEQSAEAPTSFGLDFKFRRSFR